MYNVMSADGYIAQINGKDLRQDLWDNFLKLCQEYDTFITGRKTYDSMQKYSHKMISQLETLPIKKIVISRDENFKPKAGYTVMHNIQDAKTYFENALLSSGPTLNSALFKEGCIAKIILDKLPTNMCQAAHSGACDPSHKDHLKDCIKYFDTDINPELKLEATEDLGDGIVRSIYTI